MYIVASNIIMAFALGVAYATPLGGGSSGSSLDARSTDFCDPRENPILQLMLTRRYAEESRIFCRAFVGSAVTTTETATITTVNSTVTVTVTPKPTVLTETNTPCVLNPTPTVYPC